MVIDWKKTFIKSAIAAAIAFGGIWLTAFKGVNTYWAVPVVFVVKAVIDALKRKFMPVPPPVPPTPPPVPPTPPGTT